MKLILSNCYIDFLLLLPLGMVQICCSCHEKHANQAEGGTSNSIDGRFTPSDNKSVANSESSIVRFRVSGAQRIWPTV